MKIMNISKKLGSCAGTALLIASGFSSAAMAAEPDWEGFYAGAVAGYQTGDITGLGALAGVDATDKLKGFTYGVLGGYNWQNEDWVYGIEGDISAAGTDGDVDVLGVAVTEDINWVADIRARVGTLISPSTLLYGAGGVSFSDIDINTNSLIAGNDSGNFTGWTAGVGAETRISDNAIARLEYLYTDYGTKSMFAPVGGGVDIAYDLHSIRVAVVYRFGN